MNNRAMTLAVLIALFATYLVWSWVSDVQEKAQRRYGTTVKVLKAKRDIKESETIDGTMVEWDNLPNDFKEPSAIYAIGAKEEDELDASKKSIVDAGPVALVPIRSGEQITYNKITEPGVRTGLAAQIAPGKRAVAISVNDLSSVSKLIKPGDRVDVVTIIDFGGNKTSKVVRTFMQDVVVLSVGKNVTGNIPRAFVEYEGNKQKYRSLAEDVSYNTVTLEVDPLSAQQLMLLQDNGSVFLTLRNNDDDTRAALPTSRLGDIVGVDMNAQRTPAMGAGGGR